MGSTYSMHRIGVKYMHEVRWETSKEREHYEDLGKVGRIIIIIIIIIWV